MDLNSDLFLESKGISDLNPDCQSFCTVLRFDPVLLDRCDIIAVDVRR